MKNLAQIIFILLTVTSYFYSQSYPPNTANLITEWENAGSGYLDFCPSNDSSFDYVTEVTLRTWQGIMDKITEAKNNINPSAGEYALVKIPAWQFHMHKPIKLDGTNGYNNIVIRGIESSSGEKPTLNFWYDVNYPYDYGRKIIELYRTERIGIENISITTDELIVTTSNEYALDSLKYTIYFYKAKNCWIKNYESFKARFQHIAINDSEQIEIRESYFHEAHDYGAGGHGYGVNIESGSEYCLVEDNMFRKLRHSMIIAGDASYNVFGFNYSREQHDQMGSVLGDPNGGRLGDLNIHGGNASKNLFESNRVDRISTDNISNNLNSGTENYFFRNYSYYKEMKIEYCNGALLIGNEANLDSQSNSTIDFDYYGMNSSNQYSHTNYDTYTNFQKQYSYLSDESLYKTGRPTFFTSTYTWPAIGPWISSSSIETTQDIPARERWFTLLKQSSEQVADPNLNENLYLEFQLKQNFPNPFNPSTKIEYSLNKRSLVMIRIYNSLGQEIIELVNDIKTAGNYSVDFNANKLPSGLYYYRLSNGKNSIVKKMILLK